MNTVFKVGMKVYDSVFFPKSEGEVVNIEKHIDGDKVIVQFDCIDYELPYSEEGRLSSSREESMPTLSTSPYTFQGFEQEAPAITYESIRAEGLKKGEYVAILNGLELPDERTAKAFEALAKLIWIRDYYNDGWKPDWNNRKRDKFCIMVDEGILIKESFQSNNKVFAFKTEEVRDNFFEEQRALLEIAKPLL